MNQEESKNSLFQIPETCPSCGAKYSGTKASIISSDKNSLIIHVTCPKCKTSIISNVSFNNLGIVAVGMLTDLEEGDLDMLKENGSITVDEVIEMHEYMENNGFIPTSIGSERR